MRRADPTFDEYLVWLRASLNDMDRRFNRWLIRGALLLALAVTAVVALQERP